MADIKTLVEQIKGLSVIEINDLVKELETVFGVSAAAQVAAAPAAGAAAAVVEEKTEFDVILKAFAADKKLAVIKVVREITGLGLGEAKTLVESAPKTVKEGATKDAAKDIAAKITAAGGEAEVK